MRVNHKVAEIRSLLNTVKSDYDHVAEKISELKAELEELQLSLDTLEDLELALTAQLYHIAGIE